MALPPAFLDELRGRTPMAALVGRRVKLKRSGKSWSGCCPFHHEKSPSFHVYDDGYHCFGCGAHGDALSFVMQTEGRSFPEAVENLAAAAGMEVPKPTRQAAEAEQKRVDLHGVLEAAQAGFVRALAGSPALPYLRRRGLDDATVVRFGLGWAGDGRGTLPLALDTAQLVEAGLMRVPVDDNGREGPARPLFFNRVTFPIRDRQGRLVSFGGRTLGDAKPKYINGPETPIFSKKRHLYALDLARTAVRGGAVPVVAEGYMDVIALHAAGFGGAVAPLGTALTEEQLAELWRLSPSPVLCFDGDAAGARAAVRAAELALPLLTPERTLRIVTLPGGEDPDSILRTQGAAALTAAFDGARPLADAMFRLLSEGVAATPEARAAFKARLDEAAGRIADKGLGGEYRAAWRDMFYASRRSGPVRMGGGKRPVKAVAIARVVPPAARVGQARCLTAILLRHPGLLHDVGEAYGTLDLPAPFDRVRHALLEAVDLHNPLESAAVIAHVGQTGLSQEVADLLSERHMPLPACARTDAMPAEAEAGWYHFFGLLNRTHLDDDIASAGRSLAGQFDEGNLLRLVALNNARLELTDMDNDAEY